MVVTTDDLSLWLHDALRIIAEEDLSDTAKVAADVGNARDGYTEALLKRLVETGVDPKTLVVKSQIQGTVYRTWVEQEDPVSDAYKSPAPQSLNAPPPKGMPIYVWNAAFTRGERVTVNEYDPADWIHWWPCFVPLDAEPGSVWALYTDGAVAHYKSPVQIGDGHVYIYTVTPKEGL